MENDAVLFGAPGKRFWLAGLGDQLAHWVGPHHFEGVDDLPGTLARVNTDDPVILLAHEPDIFPEVPERVALTLAGHTHGGQIRLPFVPPLWAPSEYGARYAYGHIVERGRHMIVSGGLGCSKVPLRLGVPPEIVRSSSVLERSGAKTKTAPAQGRRFVSPPASVQFKQIAGLRERGLNGESPCPAPARPRRCRS